MVHPAACSPGLPGRGPRRFRGNARGPARVPVTRRIRPGATSRTARRSACPPPRCSPAPPPCRGCGTATRRGPGPGPAPPPQLAIRRAARERDHGRCRYPGCESRRTDLHHIQHWINGGRTDLDNLISLCPWHHKVVHDRGYLIAAPPPGGGTFTFYRPDGSPLPTCPPLPEPDGPIDQAHDADDHPGHHHPALVRRAPRPGPRHLGLLRQRQDQARTPSGDRTATRRAGPRHDLRTRRLARTDPPVQDEHPPDIGPALIPIPSELRCRSPLLGCAHA